MRQAVFLDRDGTINEEKHHLFRIEDWEWIPGAKDAIAEFNRAGYLVVVVTNQSGIARGLYTEDEVRLLHDWVDEDLARHGARIDAYYHCPHHPDFAGKVRCDCRKPGAELLRRAARELDIDLHRSWLVGDTMTDIAAANAAGLRSILVRTGHGALVRLDGICRPFAVRDAIADASRLILEQTADLCVVAG